MDQFPVPPVIVNSLSSSTAVVSLEDTLKLIFLHFHQVLRLCFRDPVQSTELRICPVHIFHEEDLHALSQSTSRGTLILAREVKALSGSDRRTLLSLRMYMYVYSCMYSAMCACMCVHVCTYGLGIMWVWVGMKLRA